MASTQGDRTYESALAHLAALQSNKAITSLFSPPTIPTPSNASPGSTTPKIDLNALAIPEMLAWLTRAGLSQDEIAAQLRCIHVAGTKGKGSVCAHLTALLTRGAGAGAGVEGDGAEGVNEADTRIKSLAGKVGTYTSPHLASVRERIAIDGKPISRALFARYFFEVWDACTEAARSAAASSSPQEVSEEELQGPSTKPFYFRFLTLVALRAFISEGVRSAVIECGIGGEYDSTNILPARAVTASVVSQLGIDHVGMLGATLPEIAWHKAGVCKDGRRCFTRRLTEGKVEKGDETMRVLRERAEEKNGMLVEVEDNDVETWGGVSGSALEGGFQKYNQALAVLAAREHLRILATEDGIAASDFGASNEKTTDVPTTMTSALRFSRLRGRCETYQDPEMGDNLTWLIDGAHTAESLAEVARWSAGKSAAASDSSSSSVTTSRILLFNQQDRDAAALVTGLLKGIDTSSSSSNAQQQPAFSHAILTRNDLLPVLPEEQPETRDLSAQKSAAQAVQSLTSGSTSTSVLDNVADAVTEIRFRARTTATSTAAEGGKKKKTIVLVTGSLHLVGALLRTLEPDSEL
ncbi:FolC bifunctional protein [Xylariaceae sp. FL0255]|nr:FolC bifunctional protein [Xylariaceae sp. FL0255]